MGAMSSSEGHGSSEPVYDTPNKFADGAPIKSQSSVSRVSVLFHNHTAYQVELSW